MFVANELFLIVTSRQCQTNSVEMSKNKDVVSLKHGEIQKRILAAPPKIRPKEDQLGPSGKYRDENFEAYNRKRRQFLDACKKYNRLNQETLITCKKRLWEDYRDNLDLGFLVDSDEEDCKSDCHCERRDLGSGRLVRQRTVRPIHETVERQDEVCTLEAWFRRYLKLNKFIWAARTIVIRNRLLKVLEKLKTVTPEQIAELEKRHRRFHNVSYAELFERFLQENSK